MDTSAGVHIFINVIIKDWISISLECKTGLVTVEVAKPNVFKIKGFQSIYSNGTPFIEFLVPLITISTPKYRTPIV